MCRTTACTIGFYSFDESGFYIGMIGQAEIVIAAKTKNLTTIDNHLRLLLAITDPPGTVEVICFAILKFLIKVFQNRGVYLRRVGETQKNDEVGIKQYMHLCELCAFVVNIYLTGCDIVHVLRHTIRAIDTKPVKKHLVLVFIRIGRGQ